MSTRGIYATDEARGYVPAYDVGAMPWSSTAEAWWSMFATRRWLAGGFVWTGFDYRGEPTPYGWPCISSHFGLLDTCGFLKDNAWYYKAWWGDAPVLHLFPHWNWSGREGQEIEVWCHTNLERVELFLDGRSLGTRDVARNSHVMWKVPYAPGRLEARGSSAGRVVLTDARETTGAPARIVLRPDRVQVAADREDVSVIAADIVDAQGRARPDRARRGDLHGVRRRSPARRRQRRPEQPRVGSRPGQARLQRALHGDRAGGGRRRYAARRGDR